MALQPCAMAFGGSSNYGNAHCPPAQSGDVSSHGAHETDQSGPSTPPCETSVSHCAFVDDFNYDGRVVKVKVKDAPSDESSDEPFGIAAPIASCALEGDPLAIQGIGESSSPHGAQPRLNVLYCVYLI